MSEHANDLPSSNAGGSTYPQAWRIASGKLLRGREVDGNLVSLDSLAMRVRRVGVHEGLGENNKPFQYIECQGDTADMGSVIVHVDTRSKVSSMGMARAMLDTHAGMDISFQPRQADRPTDYGNYVTYCNVSALSPTGGRGARLGDTYNPDDTIQGLIESLKKLPHYGERKKKDEDDDGGYDPFGESVSNVERLEVAINACEKDMIYRNPQENEGAWVALANLMDSTNYKTAEEIPADSIEALIARIRQDGPAPELVAVKVPVLTGEILPPKTRKAI